ncbi:MAG: polysaccharide biosynthesis tyrosine autokinase [Culicoidibacterales bacterium]
MEENQVQFDLKHITMILKRNLVILIFIPLAAIAFAWQINEISNPVYETTTRILINVKPAVDEEIDPNMVASYQKLVQTYAELIKSKTVSEMTGEKLGLDAEKLKSLVDTINVQTKDLMQLITISVRASDPQLAQAFLTTLLESVQEVGTENIGINMIQVVDEAVLPVKPVAPNKTINLVTGAAVGVVLAAFIAFLRDYLDTRVHDVETLTKITNYPVIGKIIRMKGSGGFVSDKKIYGSEAYRFLRIKIQSLAEAQKVQVILVTSAIRGEGKTQILLNLGDLLAKSGKKVLLIDGNIRQPKVHTFFDLENTQGLTTLLEGQDTLENLKVQTNRNGIDVLVSGPNVEHPDEIFSSENFSQLLRKAKGRYDFVLIDSAPVLMYADTLSLIQKVDAAVLVSRHNKIKMGQLQKTKGDLMELQVNVLGIIANQFPVKKIK